MKILHLLLLLIIFFSFIKLFGYYWVLFGSFGSWLKQDKITYNHEKMVNIYNVYEINKNNNTTSSDPTLENYLFGAVSLTNICDTDKYKYSGYGIGFDRRGSYSHPSGGAGGNVKIVGVDMSSSIKIDNRKKDIFVLDTSLTQGLEHTMLAEKIYSIRLLFEFPL